MAGIPGGRVVQSQQGLLFWGVFVFLMFNPSWVTLLMSLFCITLSLFTNVNKSSLTYSTSCFVISWWAFNYHRYSLPSLGSVSSLGQIYPVGWIDTHQAHFMQADWEMKQNFSSAFGSSTSSDCHLFIFFFHGANEWLISTSIAISIYIIIYVQLKHLASHSRVNITWPGIQNKIMMQH